MASVIPSIVHFFMPSVNVAGTVSVFQGMIHRFFNGISCPVFVEGVAVNHSGRKNGGNGVGNPFPAISGAEP